MEIQLETASARACRFTEEERGEAEARREARSRAAKCFATVGCVGTRARDGTDTLES